MRRKLFFKQYFKLKKKVKCISIWVIVLHQRPAFSSRPFQPLHLMNWFSNLLMLTHHVTDKPWLFFSHFPELFWNKWLFKKKKVKLWFNLFLQFILYVRKWYHKGAFPELSMKTCSLGFVSFLSSRLHPVAAVCWNDCVLWRHDVLYWIHLWCNCLYIKDSNITVTVTCLLLFLPANASFCCFIKQL